MILAYLTVGLLGLAIIAYAALGGVNFGGGIWDLLASGPTKLRQRHLIDTTIGPVWEVNHIWLIFLIVGLLIAFPLAFTVLTEALFVPFILALFGVALRGAAFVLHLYAPRATRLRAILGRTFSAASTITPFLLGAIAAAIASGRIRWQNGRAQADIWAPWTAPFALTIGAMAISLCAVLAAIYLTVRAEQMRDGDVMVAFRVRAILAGAVTAFFGALGLIQAPFAAPLLWNGMIKHALIAIIITMLVGLCAGALLLFHQHRLARVLIILETICLLGAWGLAQLPYLIPPDVTVANAAAPTETLVALLVGMGIGLIVLLPALWFLFHASKGRSYAPKP